MKNTTMVTLQKHAIGEYHLPVLLIELKDRHIISIPSQVGCPVGCAFCPSSKNDFVRHLTAEEMFSLYEFGKTLASPDRPVVNAMLSFTGEGEPLLNVNAINEVMALLADAPEIYAFRICMSGIRHRNLNELLPIEGKRMHLQVSLHSPWDSSRGSLIKHTAPIGEFLKSIELNRYKFAEVAWNYVLMRDFNDRWGDFTKLLQIVPETDAIKLNRLLGEAPPFYPSGRQSDWASALKMAGRKHFSYTTIGQSINESFVDDMTYEEMEIKRKAKIEKNENIIITS